MIDKTVPDAAAAVAGIPDGATVMIGGFGRAGQPVELIDALIEQGAGDLTIVSNNAGNGDAGLAALLAAGGAPDHLLVSSAARLVGVRRALPGGRDRARDRPAGQPRRAHPRGRCRHRRLLLADRRGHAAGRGQGDSRQIDGRDYVLEYPIKADFALVSALKADRWGNLVYRKTARNFGPIMASAATTTIVQVDEIVPLGDARSGGDRHPGDLRRPRRRGRRAPRGSTTARSSAGSTSRVAPLDGVRRQRSNPRRRDR